MKKILFEKYTLAKKANQILAFFDNLPLFVVYHKQDKRNLFSIELINKIIIPTCGSEGDIMFWKQVISEIENMGDEKLIEYEEPKELKLDAEND